RLAQETMKLYKDTGTNPFASCLPILLQMPIFLSLFRLLNEAANERPKGILSQEQATQFGEATLFGGRIADTFLRADGDVTVMLLAATLVVAMTATTFLTQRQLMSKNMPADAMSGPYAQQQKMLLYILPLVFAIGGVAFPIGVLLYWTTSNLWTMGQQFYVIRRNPAPGTPAAKAKADRDAAKAARKGRSPGEDSAAAEPATVEEPPRPAPGQPTRAAGRPPGRRPTAMRPRPHARVARRARTPQRRSAPRSRSPRGRRGCSPSAPRAVNASPARRSSPPRPEPRARRCRRAVSRSASADVRRDRHERHRDRAVRDQCARGVGAPVEGRATSERGRHRGRLPRGTARHRRPGR